MGDAAEAKVTFDAFLNGEHTHDVKHELVDGVLITVEAVTSRHSTIANLLRTYVTLPLLGKCAVHDSDMAVYIDERNGLRPDMSIVCGKIETRRVYDKNGKVAAEALINPVAIAEVLSPSTERYDRDVKMNSFMSLPTLREYALIAQDRPSVGLYRRVDSGKRWIYERVGEGERFELHGVSIDVGALYVVPSPA